MICNRLGTTRYNGPASQERRRSATYAVQRERLAGLFEGFAEVGIGEGDVEVDERFVASRASGGEGLDAILSRRPDVTAICCLADVLALGVLDAAGRRGLRVAQDLTVTGFDDIPESAGAGLTTVHQPLGLKGREAGRLLLERLAEAAPGRAVSGRHPRRHDALALAGRRRRAPQLSRGGALNPPCREAMGRWRAPQARDGGAAA